MIGSYRNIFELQNRCSHDWICRRKGRPGQETARVCYPQSRTTEKALKKLIPERPLWAI